MEFIVEIPNSLLSKLDKCMNKWNHMEFSSSGTRQFISAEHAISILVEAQLYSEYKDEWNEL